MKTQPENSQSLKLTIFKPPQYIYKLCRAQPKTPKKQGFQIYFNNEFSLRRYSHKLNISNQTDLHLYEWRKQTQCPIVKIAYLELTNKSLSNSSHDNNIIDVNVYTQHLQKLLADMINLNLCESIYVLRQCLQAYQQLFVKFFAVSINKFYVGLNGEGKLKVWMNQNFALNTITNQFEQSDSQVYEVLTNQHAIVTKILHLVNLLAHSSCKHFFYGLEKSLQIKKQFYRRCRFTFNNCLEYIQDFISKTKNFQIPTNLSYMLPKKSSFSFQRSVTNHIVTNRVRNQNEKKQNELSNVECTTSFKHFGSLAKFSDCQFKNHDYSNKKMTLLQNNLRLKRHSQQLNVKMISTLPVSKKSYQNSAVIEKSISNGQQGKLSLQTIVEKNMRLSGKSRNVSATRKSNISLKKLRPSINIVPAFLAHSTKYKNSIEKRNLEKSQEKSDHKFIRSQHSLSLKNSQSKKSKIIKGSKIKLTGSEKFKGLSKKNSFDIKELFPKSRKFETETSLMITHKRTDSKIGTRVRSASQDINIESYHLTQQSLKPKKNHQTSIIEPFSPQNGETFDKQRVDGEKVSMKTISNEGTTQKRSFLTKTNYDSNAGDTDKNFSSSRMDFSSMSLENRITNKNFESDVISSKRQDTKRSLMTFKYKVQKILQNPSCKQVEQENETKSYNGSSLKNTGNIEQIFEKINKKNEETNSNSQSSGKKSNKPSTRNNLNDSIQLQLLQVKKKNDQCLSNNQWKKTITNLQQMDETELNQSIVDTYEQVVQRDPYPQVRLQKLERLGKQMCFSIVKKTDETRDFTKAASNKLKSQLYQIF